MARRAGKAANRKARQRNVKRASRAASSPAANEPEPVAADTTQDAPGASAPSRTRRPATRSVAAGSTLTSSERAEYHYVERDLRNIGILTAAMAAMLLVAWLIFSALDLVG